MDERLDVVASVDRGADRFRIRRVCALADQKALCLDSQHDGHQHQKRANREGAHGIEGTVAGENRQADAEEGEQQPEKRGDVLQ